MDKHKIDKNLEEEILEETFAEAKSKVENENKKDNAKQAEEKMNNSSKNENKKEENKEETKKAERCVSCEEYLKLKYQLADMINKYKQLDSEFENYRKRTREEMKEAVNDGKIKAIELVLPALDSFKKARLIVKDEKNLEGINLIEKSLMSALEKHGVKRIDCIGKEFNPNLHNAVATLEDKTKKSGTVIDEVEAGYTLNDKVIKFSQVVVSK